MAEPFNKLVKLAARAFYDDFTTKGDNQPKTGRSDNRGLAVVVLDALTKRQWVREEDLAKSLKLHTKQLRRTLRFFEEEKLVTRDHRKETAKGAKIFSAAVAAMGAGQQGAKEGDEKLKLHTHSYCCLDYAQIYDVVRYRLHRMKKKMKDELDNRNTIQEYICPHCSRRYSAFDALQLVSPNDDCFHCENCNSELIAESDKLAAEEIGDGDDNTRRRRREKLKDMLQKMEEQLKPLNSQLSRVKDLTVPEFGTLQAWEARANAAGRSVTGVTSAADASKSSQGQGYSGTPMPYLGETKVEVTFSGADVKEEGTEPDAATASLKVLPPWMIKQGMNLTKEQRGEVKPMADAKISARTDVSDDKQEDTKEDLKRWEEEYITAFYKAYAQTLSDTMQQESEISQPSTSNVSNGISDTTVRRVGMKSKREDDEDDGIEWEEASPIGVSSELPRVNDLNAQADVSGDDDDEIEWEEG
uniref:General transcription factor IIE subunit 1 n=1 Tax=Anthurium amnicola TaxID=1678845 RepID=A0A1D1YH39_9ARAE